MSGRYFTPRPQAELTGPKVDPATCGHLITQPAAWPRWRVCTDCGQTVHRINTEDFRLLADARVYHT